MAILGVLFFVTLSYLDVIKLYTKAGGAYVVARENFGPKIAQIAAVALLIDYTVTVAVQTAAGTDGLTSAFPVAAPAGRCHITVAVILLLLYGNLRGIKEAGKFFAFPTYFFIVSLGLRGRRRVHPERPWASSTPSHRAHAWHGQPGCPLARPARHRSVVALRRHLHHPPALVRQRRLVADRPRGHLQRRGHLPRARVAATPARRWWS